MIASLRGKLIYIENSQCIIEVAGVGYEVEMPINDLLTLKLEQEVFVYIMHVVREDAESLYGFLDLQAKNLFKHLLKVSGVGPKMALAVLSTYKASEFIALIVCEEVLSLQKIKGVGKRTAERMIVELKDILKHVQLSDELQTQVGNNSQNDEFDMAVMALVGLGYRENESISCVKSVFSPALSLDEIIVKALGVLSPQKK